MSDSRKAQHSIVIAALLALVLIIWVEGLLNFFWIWNALPVVIALGVAATFAQSNVASKDRSFSCRLIFVAISLGFSSFYHVAWKFDLFEVATGSSTSALIFIFLPLWSLFFGLVACGLAALVL